MAALDAANEARLAAEAAAAAAANANAGISAANSYGISEALLAAHPELAAVYAMFKANNIPKALELLYASAYYKNSSAIVKTREKQKLEQPAVYADSLEKYKIAARQRLVSTGIKIEMQHLNYWQQMLMLKVWMITNLTRPLWYLERLLVLAETFLVIQQP